MTVEDKKEVTDKAVQDAASQLIDALNTCGTTRIQCVVTDEDGKKYTLKFEAIDELV